MPLEKQERVESVIFDVESSEGDEDQTVPTLPTKVLRKDDDEVGNATGRCPLEGKAWRCSLSCCEVPGQTGVSKEHHADTKHSQGQP